MAVLGVYNTKPIERMPFLKFIIDCDPPQIPMYSEIAI